MAVEKRVADIIWQDDKHVVNVIKGPDAGELKRWRVICRQVSWRQITWHEPTFNDLSWRVCGKMFASILRTHGDWNDPCWVAYSRTHTYGEQIKSLADSPSSRFAEEY